MHETQATAGTETSTQSTAPVLTSQQMVLYEHLKRQGDIFYQYDMFVPARGKYLAATGLIPEKQDAWEALFWLYKREMDRENPFLPKKLLEEQFSVLERIARQKGF
jgi:hypothetical protein